MRFQLSIVVLFLMPVSGSWLGAQPPQSPKNPDNRPIQQPPGIPGVSPVQQPPSERNLPATSQELFQSFSRTLSGAKLVGRFTVLGKEDDPPAKEEYFIRSAKKMPQGDYWLITARIKYGDKDVTVPIPLEVKWAGETPVITLTKLTIPGLGTFSSRVVFHNNKYAGTWTHGESGGHLFGTLERDQENE